MSKVIASEKKIIFKNIPARSKLWKKKKMLFKYRCLPLYESPVK